MFGVGPGGTGKNLHRRRHGRQCAAHQASQPHHPGAARRGGRRAAWLLPGTLQQKIDPYMRPLYDALYDMLEARQARPLPREGNYRGCAAGLHARPHAETIPSSFSTKRKIPPANNENVPDAPGI